MTEQWRAVAQYPGYEVSDQGRVRRGTRIRKGTPDSKGYLRVSFWVDGKAKKVAIHKLVAAAFIGSCPAGQVVRHRNGDNTLNWASNLLHGSHVDNEADKSAHGTKAMGSKHHGAKLTESQVTEIRHRHIPRDKNNSLHALAREFGVSVKTLRQIIRRERWRHVP